MTERRKLTVLDRLKVIIRQARCPMCQGKLGELTNVNFDHVHPLALGGADDIENIVAVHIDCHSAKTRGTGATTAGSDIGNIAKTRRLTKSQEAYRAALLRKETGEEKPRSRWAKRAFPKRKKETKPR